MTEAFCIAMFYMTICGVPLLLAIAVAYEAFKLLLMKYDKE